MSLHKKIEWEFLVDRAYMPLSYSFNAFVNSRKYLRRYVDISEEGVAGQLFYPNDVFWNKGIKSEVADKQIEHHKREGNKYLWNMAKICEDRGGKLIRDLKEKISRDLVKNMSAKELETLFAWTVEEIKDFSVFITIPWSLESYLNTLLTDIVRKAVGEEHLDETLAELLLPIKTNASSEETPAIWKLASLSHLDIESPEIKNKIDQFLENYGWIHVRWFKGSPITREDVIERLKAAINENPGQKLQELSISKKNVIKFAENFAKEHNLSEEEKDIIFLVKEYVYIRTYRTDTLGQAFYSLYPMIERAAELLSLTIDDILYHSESELRKKLVGEDVLVDVSARKENWALFIVDDKYELYSGIKAVEELKKREGISRDLKNTSEVKGQTAFKGHVKGRAKIILDPKDVSKVEKGDILVAVMTFPSYVVAMEKASAFVTDEGGILCHASIVAREMKKPCIISTKMGTKVFKDEDMVEVDADNGVVRIIK